MPHQIFKFMIDARQDQLQLLLDAGYTNLQGFVFHQRTALRSGIELCPVNLTCRAEPHAFMSSCLWREEATRTLLFAKNVAVGHTLSRRILAIAVLAIIFYMSMVSLTHHGNETSSREPVERLVVD